MASTHHDRFSVPAQPWARRYAQRRFVRWAVEAAVPAAVCRTATALLTEMLAQRSRQLVTAVVDVRCEDRVLRIGVFDSEVEGPSVEDPSAEDGLRLRSGLSGLHLPGLHEALGCGFGIRRFPDGTVLSLEFPRSPTPSGREAEGEDPDEASAASPAGGVDPSPAGRLPEALRRRTHRRRAAVLQRGLVLVSASGSWASLRAGGQGSGEASRP